MTDTHPARQVDPRDIHAEVDGPRYRVHVWDARRSACREWELPAVADVREAIRWAVGHRRPGETAEVHAVVDLAVLTLVRLARITDAAPGIEGTPEAPHSST